MNKVFNGLAETPENQGNARENHKTKNTQDIEYLKNLMIAMMAKTNQQAEQNAFLLSQIQTLRFHHEAMRSVLEKQTESMHWMLEKMSKLQQKIDSYEKKLHERSSENNAASSHEHQKLVSDPEWPSLG